MIRRMEVCREALEELRVILKEEHHRDFTLEETHEVAQRLFTFHEAFAVWLGKQPPEKPTQLALNFPDPHKSGD